MEKAAVVRRDAGGLERARVFTHMWLALFGQWSWDELPALPPEVILLPPSRPAEHLRLRLLGTPDDRPAHRGRRPPPRRVRCRSRSTSCAPVREPPAPRSLRTVEGKFELLDRVLHRYERHPLRWLRRTAIDRAVSVDPGPPGGRRLVGRDPAAVGVLAARAPPRGLPARPPGDARRLRRSRPVHDRGRARTAGRGCQSPVWDTALAVIALSDAGSRRRPPRARRAARLAARRGDPRPRRLGVRRPELEPGGWAFEFENDNYPDIDDTATSSSPCGGSATTTQQRSMRPAGGRCGGSTACSAPTAGGARSTSTTRGSSARRLPFCDFGEVIDPPTADVTAHVVELLAAEPGRDLGHAAHRAGRGSSTTRRTTDRGSGAGAPTTSTAPAPPCRRSPRLVDRTTTGRSGEPRSGWKRTRTTTAAGARTCARTRTSTGVGRGASTPSQTAWALLGLIAARVDNGVTAARHHAGWSRTSAPTARGTSRSSPASASPATSTSTTTCTGRCSRFRHSGATSARKRAR